MFLQQNNLKTAVDISASRANLNLMQAATPAVPAAMDNINGPFVGANTTDKEDKEDEVETHEEYYWVGNHWIPPKGVPTYTPLDFLKYFQNRNVLFIGDSTGRRAYATLYAMMESAMDIHTPATATHSNGNNDSSNRREHHNLRIPSLDHPSVIDVNKGRNRKETCENTDRRLYHEIGNTSAWLCRNLNEQEMNHTTNTTASNSTAQNELQSSPSSPPRPMMTPAPSRGKFDLIGEACMISAEQFLTNFNATRNNNTTSEHGDDHNEETTRLPSFLKDYDLVVVAIGIWDTKMNHICKHNFAPLGREIVPAEERVTNFLRSLAKASSPDLQFAYRTTGFSGKHEHDDKHWKMIQAAHDFFEAESKLKSNDENKKQAEDEENDKGSSPTTNMTLVDWGSLVSERSWDGDRIHGDIPVHYGLEARLLFAQQLLHQLLEDEKAIA